jgi:uncharacterized protein
MNIVVMSDSHLYELTPAFEELCDRYCRHADRVIHLGDMVSAAVLDFLAQFPLEAVAGNMDSPSVRERLPVKKIIRLGAYRVALIHGWGSAADLRARLAHEFSAVDAVLFGHTHEGIEHKSNGILWFNPGSIAAGRGGAPRSIGLLSVGGTLRGEIIPL